uniref:SUMO-activating enzyme subunit 1 n=1 Tax=Glossina brevipalpis TaxID=37001 RepID=A0A1A9X445_9MUSC
MGEPMDLNGPKTNGAAETELTETENELYDRQIRLWGLECQKRLRTAKVLISGLSGVGAEITKNIILSGVYAVNLNDHRNVTEEDFCAQFLVPRSALGKNRAEASIERARALNPMVKISADKESLAEKKAEYFTDFDVVVIIGALDSELLRINQICREKGIKFFSADVWGTFGYCFADLQDHSYIEDTVKHKVVSKPNEKTKTELVTTTVQKELKFPSYESISQFDVNSPTFQKKLKRTGPAFILLRILQKFRDKHNRDPSYLLRQEDIKDMECLAKELINTPFAASDMFEYVFSQISPAAAVIGGVLAQEIIKVVTRKEAPHCNVFLFDPETCCGFIETIGVN